MKEPAESVLGWCGQARETEKPKNRGIFVLMRLLAN
jgi:hypothetical protein